MSKDLVKRKKIREAHRSPLRRTLAAASEILKRPQNNAESITILMQQKLTLNEKLEILRESNDGILTLDMAGKEKTTKLKKENDELKRQLEEERRDIERLSNSISTTIPREENTTINITNTGEDEAAKFLDFMSKQYDELESFRKAASKELKKISERLDNIEVRCDQIGEALTQLQDYSYQYNVKINGVPMASMREDCETTSRPSVRLFNLLGIEDITLEEIDIAQGIPSRKSSDRPQAIICKFVRRLAKHKIN